MKKLSIVGATACVSHNVGCSAVVGEIVARKDAIVGFGWRVRRENWTTTNTGK